MTFKIPDIIWAVGHSFNLHVGSQWPGWPYVLGMPPRGDLRLWTPRTRATDVGQGSQFRRGVPAGSLRATEPRARAKIRGRKREKCRCAKKTHLHILVVTRFPFGMRLTWNPGGDASWWKETRRYSTAVVAAYLCWRKHKTNSRIGVPADYE